MHKREKIYRVLNEEAKTLEILLLQEILTIRIPTHTSLSSPVEVV